MRKEERAEYGKIVYCSEQKWKFFFFNLRPKNGILRHRKRITIAFINAKLSSSSYNPGCFYIKMYMNTETSGIFPTRV